ncbi:MAG: hypothetical protein KDA91_16570 [Planctomycetaceae bacterium]|nr:hypothetical protein [Planctomycetaceae bacterium]
MSDHRAQVPLWLSTSIVVLIALVTANVMAWRSVEPDLWGHIQYGEDWIHAGEMPRTATHTFSTPDHPWINHENFFELSVAFGQRTIGGAGIIVFKCCAGIWLLWTMVIVARRRQVSTVAAVVAMIPVAWGLAEFWLARPQLFSFLFFGVMLIAFEKAYSNWTVDRSIQYRWLWLCVPLTGIWTNSHGGFAAGLCVFIAINGLRVVELVIWNRNQNQQRSWIDALRQSKATILSLGTVCAFAVGAIFANPYGWELPWWMLVSLSQPRPEVSEWANILDGGVAIVPFGVLCLLTFLGLRWTSVRRDWVEIVVLLLIAVQTIGHVRHLAFFAIAFGYWMPAHVAGVWKRLVEWRPTLGTHPEFSRNAARMLIAEVCLVALLLFGALGWQFSRFGVDRSEYPVAAFEFMNENHIEGRLVVTFDWAQYALAALAPNTTVGFDGRYDTCYPQEVVDINFDLLFGQDQSRRHRGKNSGPVDSNRVLELGHPNLVLMDRIADRPAVQFLDQHDDWVRIYSDGLSVLWGRSTVYDDPDSPHYLPVARRRFSNDMPKGIAQWPGFPNRAGKDAFNPVTAKQASASRVASNPQKTL